MSKAPARPFDWNGANGDLWVANQARLDRMLEPFGRALFATASARPGEAVLDIGCGAGASTFDFAEAIGAAGRVLGVDISQALIQRAREQAAEVANVEFRLADAATASLGEAFDLIVSRFGVMFFDDPTAAFVRMRQALKPGGRLVFVCWRESKINDWTRLPMAAVRDLVPPPPPPDPEAPGPFSFGDGSRVERILREAGYVDIEIKPFDHPILFGEGATADAAVDDAVDLALQVGPLSRLLADHAGDVRRQALAAVRLAFRRKVAAQGVLLDGAAWIVTAGRG